MNHSKTQQQHDAFYIEQYFVKCLAEFSYYVESEKEAMIVDPLRDIDPYLYSYIYP